MLGLCKEGYNPKNQGNFDRPKSKRKMVCRRYAEAEAEAEAEAKARLGTRFSEAGFGAGGLQWTSRVRSRNGRI